MWLRRAIIELKTRYDVALDDAIRIATFLYWCYSKKERERERNDRQIVLIFVDKQSMIVQ